MFKKALKIILEFGLVTCLILFVLQIPAAMAGSSNLLAELLRLPGGENYTTIPTPPKDASGQEIAIIAIQGAIGYFKVLIGIVAIGFIVFAGARLVTSSGEEEVITKSTKGLLYSLVAFAIISMSQELGELVGFFNTETGKATGGIIKDPTQLLQRVHIFDKQVEILMTFIKYLIGSVAVLMLVVNGVKLVTGGGEEENLKKAKNGVIYSIVGLVLLIVGNTFITKVFYKIDKTGYTGLQGADPVTDLGRGVSEIVGITNFIVSFIGPMLVLLLIVGGVMYLVAGGEEESMNRAKRLIVAAIIGVIVVYGAFAVVSTVVSGSFSAPSPTSVDMTALPKMLTNLI